MADVPTSEPEVRKTGHASNVLLGANPFAGTEQAAGEDHSKRHFYSCRDLPADDRFRRFLTVLGWCLLLVGVFGTVGIAANVYFVLAWLVTGAVLWAAVQRHGAAEQRTLLWTLMAAAERGIPLREAAEAFAAERRDLIGRRAALLADYLEAGLPLALALQRSGHRVPAGVLLAAELGERTGTLGPALRRAVVETDEVENAARSMLEGFFYLAFLAMFAFGMTGFLVLKIIPIFKKMLSEFDLEVSATTQALLAVAHPDSGPFTLIGLALLVVLVLLGLRHYLLRSARELPVIRGLWWRADAALVLRWLGTAVDQKRSIGESLRLLAGYLPRPSLRRRLAKAAGQIDGGQHWCDSLHRYGLIRTREAAVLKAAERAGNLGWALEEMAHSSLRRTAWRMRAALQVAFPVAVMCAGVGVLFIILAILMPLVQLIQGLA